MTAATMEQPSAVVNENTANSPVTVQSSFDPASLVTSSFAGIGAGTGDLESVYAGAYIPNAADMHIKSGKVTVPSTATELNDAVAELKATAALEGIVLKKDVVITEEILAQLQRSHRELDTVKKDLGQLASDLTDLAKNQSALGERELKSSGCCKELLTEVEKLDEAKERLYDKHDAVSKAVTEIALSFEGKDFGVDSLKESVGNALGKVRGFFSSFAGSLTSAAKELGEHLEKFVAAEAWSASMQEVKDQLIPGAKNSGGERFSFAGLQQGGELVSEYATGAYKTVSERLGEFLDAKKYFSKMDADDKIIAAGNETISAIDKNLSEATAIAKMGLLGRVWAGEWKFALDWFSGSKKLNASIENLQEQKKEAISAVAGTQSEQSSFHKQTIKEIKSEFAGSSFSTTDFAEGDPALKLLKEIAIPTSRLDTMISYSKLIREANKLGAEGITVASLTDAQGFSISRGEGEAALSIRFEKETDTRVRVFYTEDGKEKNGLVYHDEALKIAKKVASGGNVRLEKKQYTDYTIPGSTADIA